MTELERSYRECMKEAWKKADKLQKADLLVGLPFLFFEGGSSRIAEFIEAVKAGIETFFPRLKTVLACCFAEEGSFLKDPYFSFLFSKEAGEGIIAFAYNNRKMYKRGWAIRGIMDLAQRLDAHLVILEPAFFAPEKKEGTASLTADWIKLFYQPLGEEHAGLVLPRFKLSVLDNCIAEHLIFPLVGALYNLELQGSLGSGQGISRRLLHVYLKEAAKWPEEVFEFGIDTWLLLNALEQGAEVAEVYMGQKPPVVSPVDLSYLFVQNVQVLFKAIAKKPSEQSWRKKPAALRTALLFGGRERYRPEVFSFDLRGLIANFRRGLPRFSEAVWSRIFPQELLSELWQIASLSEERFRFPAVLWAEAVFDSLLAYTFTSLLSKEDIAASLWPLFQGRLAGFLNEISRGNAFGPKSDSPGKSILPVLAREGFEAQMDTFLARKQAFLEKWRLKIEALQPFLPEIAYWEYIPGVPIILPLTIKNSRGELEHVSAIYEQLLKEYQEAFEKFSRNLLGLEIKEGSFKIAYAIRHLLQQTEENLELLIPGDIHSENGMRQMIEKIFQLFPQPQSFSLKEEIAEQLLREHPPRNLITARGVSDLDALLKEISPLDALALTSYSEESKYADWNNEWFRSNLRPEHFALSPIEPIVMDYREFPALSTVKEAPILNYLTSRIVVSNLRRGSGGEFPRIRLFTTILKSIIESEQFGLIWESFVRNYKDFGEKVINSIEGHWGVSAFSAHSIFENEQHRLLKERLQKIAAHWKSSPEKKISSAGELLERLLEAYHLGITLPDGHFVTASLWSWASYSFKGGKGFPTPLSLLVERRWFNSELFFRCLEKTGVKKEDVFAHIVELMGQGRESEDLAVYYLGAPQEGKKVIVKQKLEKELPPAGKLKRSPLNPILTPKEENSWESKYVLNCGTARIKGAVYILYRAVGADGISRLGLAVSKDGFHISERLKEPAFSPQHESEKMGCEDPRLIVIDDRVYMLYTAYDGITPQIALASISTDDFINYRWSQWYRHGLVFPNFPNKDAVLFPERFNGKLAMYHRINPNIWLAFNETFETPWPREGHQIVMGTRSGMMWDAVKIGAGAQPLKTKYGWLLIYHGVDYGFCYRLGAFLTSLDNPAELLYRSPNPILEPETSYEIGVYGRSWVPNVVFTCGAVAREDKEIFDENDEILVYYGGADSVIGVATATVGEIIPQNFRQRR